MEYFLYVFLLFVYFTNGSAAAGNCQDFQHVCDNGTRCIDKDSMCNNIDDCTDGSDENCESTTCSEGLKLCILRNGTKTCVEEEKGCDCGPPMTVLYGNITLTEANNTLEGATATLTCENGYIPTSINITCRPNGLWEDAECVAKDCGSLPLLSQGHLTLTDSSNTTYGATATVTCDEGFKANASSILCLSSGNWQPVSCKAVDAASSGEVKGKQDYIIIIAVLAAVLGMVIVLQLIAAPFVNFKHYSRSSLSHITAQKNVTERKGHEIYVDSQDNLKHAIGYTVLGSVPFVGIPFIIHRWQEARGYEVGAVEKKWYKNEPIETKSYTSLKEVGIVRDTVYENEGFYSTINGDVNKETDGAADRQDIVFD